MALIEQKRLILKDGKADWIAYDTKTNSRHSIYLKHLSFVLVISVLISFRSQRLSTRRAEQ